MRVQRKNDHCIKTQTDVPDIIGGPDDRRRYPAFMGDGNLHDNHARVLALAQGIGFDQWRRSHIRRHRTSYPRCPSIGRYCAHGAVCRRPSRQHQHGSQQYPTGGFWYSRRFAVVATATATCNYGLGMVGVASPFAHLFAIGVYTGFRLVEGRFYCMPRSIKFEIFRTSIHSSPVSTKSNQSLNPRHSQTISKGTPRSCAYADVRVSPICVIHDFEQVIVGQTRPSGLPVG